MTKLTLTIAEAASLLVRSRAAANGKGRLSDIIMPNGKRLCECTFDYVGQIGEALEAYSRGDQMQMTAIDRFGKRFATAGPF